jgi:SAM-dependent methyltransferase
MTAPAAHEIAEEARIRNAYARRQTGARESCFSPAQLFLLQDREWRVLRLLARHGFHQLTETRILDIGCGTGTWLRDLIKWGARADNLTGVDLLPDRIDEARRRCAPGISLVCGNAADTRLPAGSFDLVIQSTVFTSILDRGMQRAAAAEMLRVMRPDGLILWYDFHMDNPANPDVRGVRKHEIAALFPGCRIELERVTLAPPLTRALAPYSRLACQLLQAMSVLNTHYLGAIRRAA